MQVRKTARLHPKTVTEHKKHTKPRKKAVSKRSVPASAVKVDPKVWGTALKLANRDRSRIVVHSATEVLVINQSKRKV